MYDGHYLFFLERALSRRKYWKALAIIQDRNPELEEI
jgi:hypothetical protein